MEALPYFGRTLGVNSQNSPTYTDCLQAQNGICSNWTDNTEQGYRQWKQAERIIGNNDEQTKGALNTKLKTRCIKTSNSRDILRWGYSPKGSYSTKEAYKILCRDPTPKDPLWGKIWSSGVWPKVSLFLWLFGHQRILTWDNLRK